MQYRISRLRYELMMMLVLLLLASAAFAAGERITRSAFTSGGGALNTANLQLRVAVGQPNAGTTSSSSVLLCSGPFCGAGAPDTPDPAPAPDPAPGSNQVYLPLVAR
jgi:hypothetical protein